MADGAAGVRHVVHQDGHAVLDVAHQYHAVHLVGLLPLLVDEGEVHVEAVGDGRHAASRGRKRDGVKNVVVPTGRSTRRCGGDLTVWRRRRPARR